MGVRRSSATSVSSLASRRWTAVPFEPRSTRTRPSASDSVQAPAGVSNVNGSTPSSSAPGTARCECSAASSGSCTSKKSSRSSSSRSASVRVRWSMLTMGVVLTVVSWAYEAT